MTRSGFQAALDPMQTEMRVGRERGMERSDGRSLAGRSHGGSRREGEERGREGLVVLLLPRGTKGRRERTGERRWFPVKKGRRREREKEERYGSYAVDACQKLWSCCCCSAGDGEDEEMRVRENRGSRGGGLVERKMKGMRLGFRVNENVKENG
ncbi:hypothetical protein HAX54_002556 [Datura stramonium]|uniref:Uncharacterized protein n=1 Tax=Datura stramonium TaxID=4076 RepID=A0ABS8T5L5_DATST|nr:hypothetical protein [Datura stramonium]